MKQYIYRVRTTSVDVVEQLMDDHDYFFSSREKAEKKFDKVLKELLAETKYFIMDDYIECKKTETDAHRDGRTLRRFSMYYKFDVRDQRQRESYEVLMSFDSRPVCHRIDGSDNDNINYFFDDSVFSGEREQLALEIELTKEEVDADDDDDDVPTKDETSNEDPIKVEPVSKAQQTSVANTPLMQQYNEMKKKYPGAVLLFRIGDFYETFGEDAVTISEILGVTLTRRANGKANSIELAGFPNHVLDTYLPKLVRAGKRVAICEQLSDPKKKGKTKVIEEINPPSNSVA